MSVSEELEGRKEKLEKELERLKEMREKELERLRKELEELEREKNETREERATRLLARGGAVAHMIPDTCLLAHGLPNCNQVHTQAYIAVEKVIRAAKWLK